MKNQEWLLYTYDVGEIMVLPAKPSLVRHSARGDQVREGGRLEMRPRYREELARPVMSMDYARPVCCRYLAARNVLKAIPVLHEQDAITRPASPSTSAAMAGVVVSADPLP